MYVLWYKARKKIQGLDAVKRSRESLKARAINYLTYSLLSTDKQLIQRRFSTFKTVDDETKLAYELAKRMATY